MSLLLDALKKAAEEKLAKQEQSESLGAPNENNQTEIDRTAATQVEQTELADSTRMDPTEIASELDLADREESQTLAAGNLEDETVVLAEENSPAEITVISEEGSSAEGQEDLTSFDIEPVYQDQDPLNYSDTEIGETKSYAEDTELPDENSATMSNSFDETDVGNTKTYSEPTEVPESTNSAYAGYEHEETVLGAQDHHAIDLDEAGVDVTDIRHEQANYTVAPESPTTNKTSLTDNFYKQNYDNSPQAAANVVGLNQQGNNSKRVYLLLGICLLAGLGILSMFAYEYYFDSNEANYKLSYDRYKPKKSITEKNESNNAASHNVIVESSLEDKEDIVVKQEDYTNILDKEFDEIEALSSTATVVPAKRTQATVKKPKRKTAAKTIQIKKVKQEPLAEIVQNAYEAFNDGDIDSAKTLYQKALNRKSDNRDALLGMAAVALQENANEDARKIYANLLNVNPSDPAALAGMLSLGPVGNANDQTSISSVKLMIRQQPEDASLHFVLANLYADQQRWPEAQQSFFEAYKLDATNPDYLYNLAISLDYMGKQDAAISFYKQALLQSGIRANNIPLAETEQRISALESGKQN